MRKLLLSAQCPVLSAGAGAGAGAGHSCCPLRCPRGLPLGLPIRRYVWGALSPRIHPSPPQSPMSIHTSNPTPTPQKNQAGSSRPLRTPHREAPAGQALVALEHADFSMLSFLHMCALSPPRVTPLSDVHTHFFNILACILPRYFECNPLAPSIFPPPSPRPHPPPGL